MRAILTVDLGAIATNYRALAARAAPAACAAVVKADAYGLGAARVAPALAAAGARVFFTALAEEAVALRGVLGEGPEIWSLNGLQPGEAGRLREAAIRPMLNTPRQIEAARGEGLVCGLMLDSGMSRLGLSAAELAAVDLTGLDLALAATHLACADEPDHPQNTSQLRRFTALCADPRLSGVPASLSATGGCLIGGDFRADLVRAGIGLYGGLPFAGAAPVAALHAPALQIRDLAPGDAVGYGATWVAETPSRIAILACGYADGLHRALSGRATGFHDGVALPFAGRVSMDLIALDVTAAPGLVEGALVELLGPNQSVDALADAAGTIGYEILTSLGPRFERRYIGDAL